jgi:hypothetical protein
MRRLTLSFLLFTSITACVKDTDTKRKVSFHENGNIKQQVSTKNGKWHGVEYIYFENGNIKAIAHWNNGKRNGKNTVYYQNGKLRQERYYVGGVTCCLSNDYDSVGRLRTVVKFDSLGRIIDFAWYDSLGNRDFSPTHKSALFISQKDTITLGEVYHAEIKLGNRQFDNIHVTVGDLNDRYLLIKNTPLPKKDSTTAIFSFKPTTIGSVTITGVIQEKNHKRDSILVTPFEHSIYVKSN